MHSLPINDALFVFACGGYGTRLGQTSLSNVPKILYPLDSVSGITILEYHLRLLPTTVRIGLAAGRHRKAIEAYLEAHHGFGHDWKNFVWVPELYRHALRVDGRPCHDVPLFPYGAGAWLVFEEAFLRDLRAKGISVVVQA